MTRCAVAGACPTLPVLAHYSPSRLLTQPHSLLGLQWEALPSRRWVSNQE